VSSFLRNPNIRYNLPDIDECSQETKKLHDESKKYFDSIYGTLFLERELAMLLDPYNKA